MGTIVTDQPTVSILAATTIAISVFSGVTVADGPTVDVPSGVGEFAYVQEYTNVIVNEVSTDLEIDVFEVTTVTDVPVVSVQAAADIDIPVNDPVGVTDVPSANVQDALDITPNINDPTTVIDVPTVLIAEHIVDKSESIGVVDDPTVTIGAVTPRTIDVFDAVEVAEDRAVRVDLNIDVNDGITVTDIRTVATVFTTSRFDAVEVTDDATVRVDLNIDKADTVAVADDPTISIESAADLTIDVSDAVSVEESTDQLFEFLFVDVNDLVGVADVPNIYVPDVGAIAPNVADNIGVNEYVDLALELVPEVSDSVGAIDDPTVSILEASAIDVDVFDTVAVAENVPVTVQDATDIDIDVNDSVGVTDVPTVSVPEIGALTVNVSDGITVDENVDLALELVIDVNDGVGVVDVPTVSVPEIGALTIDVSDTVAVGESAPVAIQSATDVDIDVSDTVGVAEDKTVTVGAISDLSVSVFDAANAVDDPTVTVVAATDIDIDVSDAVTAIDAPTISLVAAADIDIDVSDSITAADVASVTLPGYTVDIDVSESVAISESVTAGLGWTETLPLNSIIGVAREDQDAETFNATVVEYTIGTGQDYETLTAFNTAFNSYNLVANGVILKAILTDNKAYNLTDYIAIGALATTGVDNYFWITAASNVKHTGVAGTGARLVKTGAWANDTQIINAINGLRLSDVEIDAGGLQNSILWIQANNGRAHVENCIIHNGGTQTDTFRPMYIYGKKVVFKNNLVYNFNCSASLGGGYVVLLTGNNVNSDLECFNNTVAKINCPNINPFWTITTSDTVANVLSHNNVVVGIDGGAVTETLYVINGAINKSMGNVVQGTLYTDVNGVGNKTSAIFTDYDNDDYTLADTTIFGIGANKLTDVPVDLAGNNRTAVFDPGCFAILRAFLALSYDSDIGANAMETVPVLDTYDGTDAQGQMILPVNYPFSASSAYFEFWVKQTAGQTGYPFLGWVSDFSKYTYVLIETTTTTKVTLAVKGTSVQNIVKSGLTADNWHKVKVVYANSKVSLYVDNILIGTSSTAGAVNWAVYNEFFFCVLGGYGTSQFEITALVGDVWNFGQEYSDAGITPIADGERIVQIANDGSEGGDVVLYDVAQGFIFEEGGFSFDREKVNYTSTIQTTLSLNSELE